MTQVPVTSSTPTIGEKQSIVIRPATKGDMPGKLAITAHYVANTVLEFSSTPPTLEETVSALGEYQADGYPYLVAVSGTTVLGFALLGPYLWGTGGWSWTKKFTVFVHPAHLDSEIGPMLLKTLFDIVANPDEYDETWIGAQYRGEGRIQNFIGIFAVENAAGKGGHDWLLEYGNEFGLVRVGTKTAVGRKLGTWIDVVELQKAIS